MEQLKSEFSEVFQERLGEYYGSKISLKKPIFFKPRPLPFAWKNIIECHLYKLIRDGVLEEVDDFEWTKSVVWGFVMIMRFH